MTTEPSTPKAKGEPHAKAVIALCVFVAGAWLFMYFDACAVRGTRSTPVDLSTLKTSSPRAPGVPAPAREPVTATPSPTTPSEAEIAARLAERQAAAPARHWYDGGTLHHATGTEWKAASYEDKLATAGDLLAKLWLEKRLKPHIAEQVRSVDDLKPLAAQVVVGLDKAFSVPPKVAAQHRVPDSTTVLLALMGWV